MFFFIEFYENKCTPLSFITNKYYNKKNIYITIKKKIIKHHLRCQ